MRSNRSKELSPHDAGSVKAGLLQVIKDFSLYLAVQKQNSTSFLNISEASSALMDSWGLKGPAQASFFFEGPETAAVFIIDSDGSFFKGKPGDLLKKILKAMTLASDAVFICTADDMESVHKKITKMSPKVIITLGTQAGQALLGLKQPLEQFRGKFHDYHGIRVMPTLHPSLLLKQPEYKRQVWEDMKQVMEYIRIKDDA